MKIKKIIIILIIIAVVILISFFLKNEVFTKNSFNLTRVGNLYDNMDLFDLKTTGNADDLTQSYLKKIEYEIKNIDSENMVATLDISVPVISEELSNTVDNVISENEGMEYDDLKKTAKSELSSILDSNQIELEKTTIILQIKKTDGEYKLVPSEEWNKILTGNLEDLYIGYLKSLIGEMNDETHE